MSWISFKEGKIYLFIFQIFALPDTGGRRKVHKRCELAERIDVPGTVHRGKVSILTLLAWLVTSVDKYRKCESM